MVYTTLILISSLLGPAPPQADDYDLWKEGRLHWYEDEWEQAAAAYQKLIDQFPNSRRRCKAENYLGYCYKEMGKLTEAYDAFTRVILNNDCEDSVVDDARATRIQIAYEIYQRDQDPSMKETLLEGLADPNLDIRFMSARWLSMLDDPSGLEVFFEVLQNADDQDRRDLAAQEILKVGSNADKERLDEILNEQKQEGRKAKMVRLIVRDLKSGEVTVRLNLPISLFKVLLRSLSDDQLEVIEEQAGIDLRNFDFEWDSLQSGYQLFRVIDGDNQEIKMILE